MFLNSYYSFILISICVINSIQALHFLNLTLRRAFLNEGESDMYLDLKITNFTILNMQFYRTELAEFGHFSQKFDFF